MLLAFSKIKNRLKCNEKELSNLVTFSCPSFSSLDNQTQNKKTLFFIYFPHIKAETINISTYFIHQKVICTWFQTWTEWLYCICVSTVVTEIILFVCKTFVWTYRHCPLDVSVFLSKMAADKRYLPHSGAFFNISIK